MFRILPTKRNPSAMRQQIINSMLKKGERSRLRKVILIIDEAHPISRYLPKLPITRPAAGVINFSFQARNRNT
jgi:hypothetical protein